MGIFNVSLEIGDPQGHRYETVEAMVDSGAAYTIMPTSLLDRLGVVPHTSRTFVLADGSWTRKGFGQTWMRLRGQEDISPVVFWDEETTPLLGKVTLGIFSLGIDSVNNQIIPIENRM